MHSSVATLACSLPDLEASSKSLRVVGTPGELRGPVVVTVVETNGVYLLFITLDTVRGTNIVSVDPGLSRLTALEGSGKAIENRLEKSRFHLLLCFNNYNNV